MLFASKTILDDAPRIWSGSRLGDRQAPSNDAMQVTNTLAYWTCCGADLALGGRDSEGMMAAIIAVGHARGLFERLR
jgi:hypothetical protein